MEKKDNSNRNAWIIVIIVCFLLCGFIGAIMETEDSYNNINETSAKNEKTTEIENKKEKNQGDEKTDNKEKEQIFKIDNNIQNTEIVNKDFGESMISELKKLGFTVEEATEIQSIFYKIGINSLSSIKEGAGDGIDKLQSFIAYANNDTNKKFYFTVEKRKMLYAGFMDSTLYDTSKGGILKNINDVHIPETKVDMETYTTLQVKAQEVVKQYLNYPNTASFPLYDGWGIARSDDNYKIYGKVSAQNGFSVKSDMSFSVYFKKSNNDYTVEAVLLDGTRVK